MSFSVEPEAVRAGLCGTVVAAPAVAFLRHTNLSKSCSSLHSLSWMWFEHGFPSSIRSDPVLSMMAEELRVVWLAFP